MRFGVDLLTGRVEPRDDNAREPVKRVPLLAARLSVSRSRAPAIARACRVHPAVASGNPVSPTPERAKLSRHVMLVFMKRGPALDEILRKRLFCRVNPPRDRCYALGRSYADAHRGSRVAPA